MKTLMQCLALTGWLTVMQGGICAATDPVASQGPVFAEADGLIAVEAELAFQQTHADQRAWRVTSSSATPDVSPDGDPPHLEGASGGAYLEALPDTRRTDEHQLISGENFSNEPGRQAILYYKVHFQTPGRYYVWARVFSTGAEDNGLHVGIDDKWPESGQRMQWTAKDKWVWDSKQRTQTNPEGEPGQLYLDVDEAGEHTIMFSMREDGCEFDKWLMTRDRKFARPEDAGPELQLKSGQMPAVLAVATVQPTTESKAPSESRSEQGTQQPPLVLPRGEDGDGRVAITGENRQWHKLTLTLDGPFAHERDNRPNPFLGYRMTVRFTHESGKPEYVVPGYFAADGNAANTSAQSGTKWRAHVSPDKPGEWTYEVSFYRGRHAAIDPDARAAPVAKFHGKEGKFTISATDKKSPDFRSTGRLQYVGKHYLRATGSGEYFLKAGADSPETLLAYADFDGTKAFKKNVPLKKYQAHVQDWHDGDPTWKDGKGKGLIGALNYLVAKGCNAISFMPYNAGGDGDNVWPFVARNNKLHYDCSKLDQWAIVLDHATAKGIYLHFKMQETEFDDNRMGHESKPGNVPTSLDGGALGPERKLYCRELIARFGHELALNWNIGEENTQSTAEVQDMARYIDATDPYNHLIVIHTFPNEQNKVYRPLLGDASVLTGASLQNQWNEVHPRTNQWVRESQQAGRPWVVANDEQGPADQGVPPDPGYDGKDGIATMNSGTRYSLDDIRKLTLWGNLLAGGAGVEYYFGYQLPQNDLNCEDFRSRDRSWDYCRIALDFFRNEEIPFWEMNNADELIGNSKNDNSKFCFANRGEIYLVYLPNGGTTSLDLSGVPGEMKVRWFNPRTGGELVQGSIASITGGGQAELGQPPENPHEDWLIVCRK